MKKFSNPKKLISTISLYSEYPLLTGCLGIFFTEVPFREPKENMTRQEFERSLHYEFEYSKEVILDHFYPHKKIPQTEP